MSFELSPDGKAALRIQMRTFEDGWMRAGLQMPDSTWVVLLMVPAAAWEGSTEVQAAVIAATQALVRKLLHDIDPGLSLDRTEVVAPGAPMGAVKH